MIRSFEELIEKVQNGEPQTLSVAVAQDADVLTSGMHIRTALLKVHIW